MRPVVKYAANLIQRGYSAYPASVGLNDQGEKTLAFKDGRWAMGDYPTDPAEIETHWEGFEGIVINTGRSGLVVVDIDVSKGKDGWGNLKAAGITLPETPVKAQTATGGEHWFYREGDTPVQSDNSGKLARDVDIRARGAIVIAPPTEIAGRGAYKFLGKVAPVAELPVFPADLAARLQPKESTVTRSDVRPLLTVEQRERLVRRFDRLMRELAVMEDGNRNASMRLKLIRVFGIAKTLDENPDAVAALVRDAYRESGGTDSHQVDSFIDWALKHAEYEVPDDETDEEFEAAVRELIRKEQIRTEAKQRMSPVKVNRVSDDDVLTYDPDAAKARWLVEDYLPKGVTGLLYGPPNIGKSFAAIDLGCGVATGTCAWGRPVPRGRAIYLAGEGHAGLPIRQRAWETARGHKTGPDLELRRMRLILSSEESVAEHVDLVKSHGADLIIVDTMLRAMQGLTLENPNELAMAIHRLDLIREAGGPDATLLVLHHPSKSNPDVPAGSYPIEANVDTLIGLKDDNGLMSMWVKKARDAEKSQSQVFDRRMVEVPGTGLKSLVLDEHRAWATDSMV